MITTKSSRLGTLGAAALLGLAVSVGPGLSAGDPDGTRGPPSTPSAPTDQKDSTKPSTKKKKKTTDNQLHEDYLRARALIMDGQFEAGIAALRALGHDDNPEVANYIGYANRKLGNYELAKVWYERALAADPNHTRTWQYYGMWQIENGNLLKAEDYLEKIHSICGNATCSDYVKLKEAIDGNISY